MRGRSLAIALAVAGVTGAFSACKDNTVNQSSNTTNNFTTIGAGGGSVTGPDGTLANIPPGALDTSVDMAILYAEESEYPPIAGKLTPIGKIYSFLPHGQFFLVDATITMPAPNGQVDIYRAEPNGGWELFAKPKANGGFAKFRTSTFSFYAVAAGTGGCVRDLDCFTGQVCASGKCASGSDAGTDATPVDGSSGDGGGTADSGTCATPAPAGKSGTVTSTSDAGGTAAPTADGVASRQVGPDGGEFANDLRIKLGDFTNMCGYATEGKIKANSTIMFLDLFRSSSTATPPDYTAKPYTIGTSTSGTYKERINWSLGKLDAMCAAGSAPSPTGTITLTMIAVDRIVGSYDISNDGFGNAYSGNFDVPICNTTAAMSCCVP